jgi:thiamine-monophosphate kinase
MDEFALIERYFNRPLSSKAIVLGIGDDAAAIEPPPGQLLVQTMDSLHAGRHFPEHTAPADIAWKALAVNVSDLAAMGAQPAFFLLSLTLPDSDEAFLAEFSRGLFEAADAFGIELVGGDTCRGPLSITIQASGFCPPGELVRRKGAAVGDHVFVSGQLGFGALGLALVQGREVGDGVQRDLAIDALNRPTARVDLIPILRRFSTAAIDISDGLAGDLGHLLRASGVGASIQRDALPVPDWIRQEGRWDLALSGGDDYQLLFTVSDNNLAQFGRVVEQQQLDCTEIGRIIESGYFLQTGDDTESAVNLSERRGFMHFVE